MQHVGGKDIAQPADGFNQQRLMGVNFNFASQAHDQHINGAIEHLRAFAVGQLQQLFPAEYPTRVLRQRQQQSVLALGQGDHAAPGVDQFTAGGVQRPAVKADPGCPHGHRLCRQRTGAAQHGFDARHHHPGVEGFTNVVVGAHLEADHHVRFTAQARQHDHRQLGALLLQLL